MTGCSRHAATANRLPSFVVTNEVDDNGKVRQLIEFTNGLSLYVTESWITVWFGHGYDTVVGFDPKTLEPQKILWEIPPSGTNPGRAVFDVNADGVPDVSELKDGSKTRQIFYRGEWYTREQNGARTSIILDGKKQRVYFDGRRWQTESTNTDVIEVTNALISTSF